MSNKKYRATGLIILDNYFDSPTKLFSNLYLAKFLDILVKFLSFRIVLFVSFFYSSFSYLCYIHSLVAIIAFFFLNCERQ